MDDAYTPLPLAGWYMPAAVASLLFMGLGCVTYLMHVLADPNSIPLDQRAALEAEPMWVTAAYAIAVWVGLAGGALLVMKKRAAEWALLISLVAVLAWVAGLLLVAPLRDSMSANDLLVAIVVAAVVWTIYWFSRHSRQRGWLR